MSQSYKPNSLHEAARYNMLESCKSLLATGVDINEPDEKGNTPLHWATIADTTTQSPDSYSEIIALLVGSGANVNVANRKGKTPLHYLVASSKKDLVEAAQVLIAAGAKIDAPDNNGRTPLYYSMESGRGDVFKLLIQSGASPLLKDYWRMSVLEHCVHYHDLYTLELIITSGIDIDIQDSDGDTLLHKSTILGKELFVEYLIRSGANLNIVNKDGELPLHMSSYLLSGGEITEYLMGDNIDINMPNNIGNTPAHIAAANNNICSLKTLIVAKADISIENSSGALPIDLTENDDIRQLLLETELDRDAAIKNILIASPHLASVVKDPDNSVLAAAAAANWEIVKYIKNPPKSVLVFAKTDAYRKGQLAEYNACVGKTADILYNSDNSYSL